MGTIFGAVRNRHDIAAACCFVALLAASFVPMAASAADQQSSTGPLTDGEGLPPLSPAKPAGPPASTSHWTVSIEALALEHLGAVNRTLVERVPGSVPFGDTSFISGPQAFNSNQFQQGFSAGVKAGLTYRGDSGYGAELSYFNTFARSTTKATGPDSPADWLVMRAPGTFWQTQDFPYQAMAWGATTNLYSAEANARMALSSRVTLLGGFRWLQLDDTLQGTLTPADLTEPEWKSSCLSCTLPLVTASTTPAGNYPPFWNTSATNNLYGLQVGLDGKVLELGRFSLDGVLKLGIFDNNAEQSTGVSMRKQMFLSGATTNAAAFVAEADLTMKYQATSNLALTAGYEALWLDNVALAAGQIQETSTTPTTVRALGVKVGSNVLFHGAHAGLEYSF